jgi:WD40 repeat protein
MLLPQSGALQARSQQPRMGAAATCVVLAPGGCALTGHADGSIRCSSSSTSSRQNGAAGSLLWEIPTAHAHAQSCGVTALALANGGRFFASGGAGARLVHPASCLHECRCQARSSAWLRLTPQRNCCVPGGEVRLWDMATHSLAGLLKQHTAPVRALAVVQGDTQLLVGGEDRAISLWDVQQGRARGTFRCGGGWDPAC